MGKRRSYIGIVISDKMQKTVIVRIARLSKHPKYGKIVKRYNKFKAHNEENLAKAGDKVRIVETRPLSKEKCFRVAEVVTKAALPQIEIKEEVK